MIKWFGRLLAYQFFSIVFAFFWPKLWSSETMIWKTVSVRTLVPIISALIAVRDPICTWQDTTGPQWSTLVYRAGHCWSNHKKIFQRGFCVNWPLTHRRGTISLGGNNNLLFTMYNVPKKYIQSYEFSWWKGTRWIAAYSSLSHKSTLQMSCCCRLMTTACEKRKKV